MRYIAGLFLLIIATCCCFNQGERKRIRPLTDIEVRRLKLDSAHFTESAQALAKKTKIILDSLGDLSLKQKRALAGLLLIVSDVSSLSPGDGQYPDYKDSIAGSVNKYFKKAKVLSGVKYDDCLYWEIEYVNALRACQFNKKKESECPQAWAASVAAINCAENRMKDKVNRVSELMNQIK